MLVGELFGFAGIYPYAPKVGVWGSFLSEHLESDKELTCAKIRKRSGTHDPQDLMSGILQDVGYRIQDKVRKLELNPYIRMGARTRSVKVAKSLPD